eukprot:GHVO01034332.1.p1 GENE.GHVO01034332.1~~GHVO01034332.1.p1  ORF type:complete len:326 (-),score=82.08 GHVO01034332.1:197-1174(-)
MKRFIRSPRIAIVDCPLEYKKGESQTKVEITSEEHWEKLLQEEEEEIRKMCDCIIASNCDVLVTEKGVSDLAQHFLMKKGISVIRRVRKTDTNRLARASGATIINRPEEITANDIGTKCGLFKIEKIGDEYYTYFVECTDPQACSIVLRGGSKDLLNEIERNLIDALSVARNLFLEPGILPGGGAADMELAVRLRTKGNTLSLGPKKGGYMIVANALEVIPRALAGNACSDIVRTMALLRAKHVQGESGLGLDGLTGDVVNSVAVRVVDPMAVKMQMLKAGVETAATLLRIDNIVSGIRNKEEVKQIADGPQQMDNETFGDSRDG